MRAPADASVKPFDPLAKRTDPSPQPRQGLVGDIIDDPDAKARHGLHDDDSRVASQAL